MVEINEIDTKQKIRDRVKAIIDKGGQFVFLGVDDKTFRNNLILIDSCLPRIVAEILLQCYSTGVTDLRKNTNEVAKSNPIGYDMDENKAYYEYKMKNLLVASALGMVPKTSWDGEYDANGGYLVVKEDGEVLCYNFYDRNLFEDYLFANTILESPSTTRYDYTNVFIGTDGKQYFKLNLQIRFK